MGRLPQAIFVDVRDERVVERNAEARAARVSAAVRADEQQLAGKLLACLVTRLDEHP
jgi:hypothetical protein